MKKIVVGIVALVIVAGAGFGWYYLEGPCGVNKVKKASAEMTGLLDEYQDAFEIASSTSRISLSGPVATLQEIKRRADAVDAPVCLNAAQRYTVASMEEAIQGFIDFMGEADDAVVSSSMQAAFSYMASATDEVETITACAPFCKIDSNRVLP